MEGAIVSFEFPNRGEGISKVVRPEVFLNHTKLAGFSTSSGQSWNYKCMRAAAKMVSAVQILSYVCL